MRAPRTRQPHPETIEVEVDGRKREWERGQACTAVDSFRSPGVPSPVFHSVTTSGDMKHWWPDCSSVAQNTWRFRRVHLGQPPTAEQVVVERLLEHCAAARRGLDQEQREERGPDRERDHHDPRRVPRVSPANPHVSAPAAAITITATNAAT